MFISDGEMRNCRTISYSKHVLRLMLARMPNGGRCKTVHRNQMREVLGLSTLLGATRYGSFGRAVVGPSIQFTFAAFLTFAFTARPTQAQDSLSECVFNIIDYGAIPNDVDGGPNNNGDDTEAIQTAIQKAESCKTGGVVWVPAGTYRFTQVQTEPESGGKPITIRGDGRASVLYKFDGNGDGVILQGKPVGAIDRIKTSIEGLSFVSAPTLQGAMIQATLCKSLTIRDVHIDGASDGIWINGCFDTHITDTTIHNCAQCGIRLSQGDFGASGLRPTIDTYIANVLVEGGGANNSQIGLEIESGISGVYVTNSDFTQGLHGVRIIQDNENFLRPEFLFFTQVFADQNGSDGWLIGDCKVVSLTSCWGSKSGDIGFHITAGVDIRLVNCTAYGNSTWGALFEGGGGEYQIVGGMYTYNSVGTYGAPPNQMSNQYLYDGIAFGADISDFSIIGARAGGNFEGVVSQRNGIRIESGASDRYIIRDNRLTANDAGGLYDGGTGTNKSVGSNIQ